MRQQGPCMTGPNRFNMGAIDSNPNQITSNGGGMAARGFQMSEGTTAPETTTTTATTETTTKETFIEKVEHGVETVGKDIAHVVVEVVKFPAKAEKVFATIETDFPVLKPALLKLVTDGETLAADTTAVISADGLNVTLDLAEWNELLVIKADLGAAIKEIESAYTQINGDVA